MLVLILDVNGRKAGIPKGSITLRTFSQKLLNREILKKSWYSTWRIAIYAQIKLITICYCILKIPRFVKCNNIGFNMKHPTGIFCGNPTIINKIIEGLPFSCSKRWNVSTTLMWRHIGGANPEWHRELASADALNGCLNNLTGDWWDVYPFRMSDYSLQCDIDVQCFGLQYKKETISSYYNLSVIVRLSPNLAES